MQQFRNIAHKWTRTHRHEHTQKLIAMHKYICIYICMHTSKLIADLLSVNSYGIVCMCECISLGLSIYGNVAEMFTNCLWHATELDSCSSWNCEIGWCNPLRNCVKMRHMLLQPATCYSTCNGQWIILFTCYLAQTQICMCASLYYRPECVCMFIIKEQSRL